MPSALVRSVTGPLTTRSSRALCLRSPIAAATGPVVTSSALTTTVEPAASPGNASVIRSYVLTTGIVRGMSSGPVTTVCRPNAGTERATRTPPAATSETTGCRMTPSTTRAQAERPPRRPTIRCRNGIRPFSTRSPSAERTAGRTVIEANSATPTTVIVATANEMKVELPLSSIPAIAVITVTPETRTARPEVAAAAARAASAERPARRSARSRRR